jgi:hypothetical protein
LIRSGVGAGHETAILVGQSIGLAVLVLGLAVSLFGSYKSWRLGQAINARWLKALAQAREEAAG